MAMFGHQMQAQTSGRIILTGTGNIQIMDGHGFLITIGDGHLSITAAGNMILFMDGFGYRVVNGDRPGFNGVAHLTIMAGLL